MFLPKMISAGDFPVKTCDIMRYCISNFCNAGCRFVLSHFILRSELCKVCTKRSACPFVAGWYGAVNFEIAPFTCKNCWNSLDVNVRPLSVNYFWYTEGCKYFPTLSDRCCCCYVLQRVNNRPFGVRVY